MTLRVVTMALSLIAGIVLGTLFPAPFPAALPLGASLVGIALTVALFLRERRWIYHPRIVIILAAMLTAFPSAYWRTTQKLRSDNPGTLRCLLAETAPGTALQIRGNIAAEPDLRRPGSGDLRVRVHEVKIGDAEEWTPVRAAKVLVQIYTTRRDGPEAKTAFNRMMSPDAYGYRVEIPAVFRGEDTLLNPGEFNYAMFLLQSDMVTRFRCHAGKAHILEETAGNPLTELALRAKESFLRTYKRTIRAPSSRLVGAATLGTRRAVEKATYRGKDIADTFRHAGVGHVLAVSGLHVSVVSLLLYSTLRLTGLRARTFAPALIFFLVLFAILTGARPSSVRAVIMNSVVLIAFAYFRCGLRQGTYIGLAASSLLVLAVNPIVLYSPGFLLSYGAVMSLVLIAPTLDRWLCRFHGFAALFFAVWLAGVIALSTVRMEWLFSPFCIAALAGILWILTLAGNGLNDHRPAAWQTGFDRMPRLLRIFISAQLAIQAGMMFPMSAWFFGRFPVAGIFVNLLAIPAIGVLVQLGMLVGLFGLIPGIGELVALPFGVADTLVGHFFFWLAHQGARWFPFPATPQPTITWLVVYYVVLGGILSSASWGRHVQGFLYRHWPVIRRTRPLPACIAAAPFLLAVLPLLAFLPFRDGTQSITCYAAPRYPMISLVSRRGRAVIVNAGNRMSGSRDLFAGLRRQGVTRIDTAILCSPLPDAGNDGLAALLPLMPVRSCLLPLVVEDPDEYLDRLGDTWLLEQAARGKRWAASYPKSYAHLMEALQARHADVRALDETAVTPWADLEITPLPLPAEMPRRFVSSARTRVISMRTGGFQWVVVTDPHPDLLAATVREAGACDVLVVPGLDNRDRYLETLDAAVDSLQPRAIIVCGDRVPRNLDLDAWAARRGMTPPLLTSRDGAVQGERNRAGHLQLRGYVSGRTVILKP